jgi:hypothetical protein
MEIEAMEMVPARTEVLRTLWWPMAAHLGIGRRVLPRLCRDVLDLPIGRKGRKPRLPMNDRADLKSQYEDWSRVYGEGGTYERLRHRPVLCVC